MFDRKVYYRSENSFDDTEVDTSMPSTMNIE